MLGWLVVVKIPAITTTTMCVVTSQWYVSEFTLCSLPFKIPQLMSKNWNPPLYLKKMQYIKGKKTLLNYRNHLSHREYCNCPVTWQLQWKIFIRYFSRICAKQRDLKANNIVLHTFINVWFKHLLWKNKKKYMLHFGITMKNNSLLQWKFNTWG